MKTILSERFLNKLLNQVAFIYEDKPKAARKFKEDIFKEIRQISKMPWKYRKSVYYNDENIRETIFKGYVIIFRIVTEQNIINVFGFTKYTEAP